MVKTAQKFNGLYTEMWSLVYHSVPPMALTTVTTTTPGFC